jgi:hypothetical protein
MKKNAETKKSKAKNKKNIKKFGGGGRVMD